MIRDVRLVWQGGVEKDRILLTAGSLRRKGNRVFSLLFSGMMPSVEALFSTESFLKNSKRFLKMAQKKPTHLRECSALSTRASVPSTPDSW
jgi:hypothetical protein